MSNIIHHSLLSEYDVFLFKSGRHFRLHDKLGSHLITVEGQEGVYFAVWAPNAKGVSVAGNFNAWNNETHQLASRWDGSGIWEGFIPGVKKGDIYKYAIVSYDNRRLMKADPFAFSCEVPPKTASVVWDLDYEWGDQEWMKKRKENEGKVQPFAVYEVHLGSWRKSDDKFYSLNYREMADEMVEYVKEMGFTHVEMMPVMEHPYFPSWGYQVTGYFAPTSRFGTPQDFMYLMDKLHQAGIGVIMDWVPSHFPTDAHGLAQFDGTYLYEHEDPRKGFHPDWKSAIFNYSRNEVRNFLISNAIFWMEKYHADGLRVDAVASMLYLDYSREEGQWVPNKYGGKENLEAIAFLKEFNETVYGEFPDAVTIAEESTAWTGVSRPTFTGGLGFGQKWMMGWMHDTLNYFKVDPLFRKYHHNSITFSLIYAYSENFMLPLSHDEVVHGKSSLIGRMPGDEWQRFANLRTLFGYMYTHPGTKLLFMGGEFGQTTEWSIEGGLPWELLEFELHKGVQTWVKELNHFYANTTALYEKQFDPDGFEWVDNGDYQKSLLSYLRKGEEEDDLIVVAINFTPVPHEGYKMGVPVEGTWVEQLNSDRKEYGGTGENLNGEVVATEEEWNGRPYNIQFDLPPLSVIAFQLKKDESTQSGK